MPPQPAPDARVAVTLVAGQRLRPLRRGLLARYMTTSNTFDSLRCPAVTSTARMVPRLSQARCSLVPKPPCERPNAWSCGSSSCIEAGPASLLGLSAFFPRPGGGSAGADDGGVDKPQLAVDEAFIVQPEQQSVENLGPGAVLAPAVEAVVDGLPGSVTLRGVRPGSAGVQVPENAVDKGAMILPGVAGLAVMEAVGEERLDEPPLLISEVVAVQHGTPPSTNPQARDSAPVYILPP